MAIAMDQSWFVMSHLQRMVPDLDAYEPGDPAPYVNCRPWGAVTVLGGHYGGNDPEKIREHRQVQRAIKYTLKLLADDGEITLFRDREEGIIAGVWLGQPLGNARAKIPVRDRDLVLARDGYACSLCDATDNLTIDHIFPVVRGGSGDPINLRVLCRSCNSAKGASIPNEIRLLGRPRDEG